MLMRSMAPPGGGGLIPDNPTWPQRFFPDAAVVVRHADRSMTAYNPAADTNDARGDAFIAALAAVVATDKMFAGHDRTLSFTTPLDLPDGVDLYSARNSSTIYNWHDGAIPEGLHVVGTSRVQGGKFTSSTAGPREPLLTGVNGHATIDYVWCVCPTGGSKMSFYANVGTSTTTLANSLFTGGIACDGPVVGYNVTGTARANQDAVKVQNAGGSFAGYDSFFYHALATSGARSVISSSAGLSVDTIVLERCHLSNVGSTANLACVAVTGATARGIRLTDCILDSIAAGNGVYLNGAGAVASLYTTTVAGPNGTTAYKLNNQAGTLGADASTLANVGANTTGSITAL